MKKQEQYRIRECNGVFTIQTKWRRQQKPFNPKNKLLEDWVDLDENGCISLIDNELSGVFKQYESIELAQKAMDSFIERRNKRVFVLS
jgi:hypothetical protein